MTKAVTAQNGLGESITIAAFARQRGISRQAAHKWKAQGLLVLDEDGKVVVAASNARIDARPQRYRGGKTVNRSRADVDGSDLVDDASHLIDSGSVTLLSHAEAVRKKENYLALLRQLEYDRESGAVAEIAAVVAGVTGEYAKVRNLFLGLGARIAPRVAILRSPEAVKALVDDEVTTILKELTLDGADGGSHAADRTIRSRFASPSR